jgi:hypothetical protein
MQDLRGRLVNAKGRSQKLIALFVDIRDFTSFAGLAESTDAADFLRCAYSRMLERYFAEANFVKLTGDGMMVIYHFEDEQSYISQLRKAVSLGMKLVKDFPTITKGDPMIPFEVPERLGIGIARGSGTLILAQDGSTIDYTGRPLNLAARLMDIARPLGVVLDGQIGVELLTPTVRVKFGQDVVFINGIAEEEPRPINYQLGHTEISEYSKLPIRAPQPFTEERVQTTCRKISEKSSHFLIPLTREPAHLDGARLHLTYPKATKAGRQHATDKNLPSFPVKLMRKENRWRAWVDFSAISAQLKRKGCKPGWPVTYTLEYSVRDTGTA